MTSRPVSINLEQLPLYAHSGRVGFDGSAAILRSFPTARLARLLQEMRTQFPATREALLAAGASPEKVRAAIEELTWWRARATKTPRAIAILEMLMIINIALTVAILAWLL